MKLTLFITISIVSLVVYWIVIEYIKKFKKEKLLINLGSNLFIDEINRIIEENKYNLFEERRRLKGTDTYGNEILDKWFVNPPVNENLIEKNKLAGSTKFKEGISYF